MVGERELTDRLELTQLDAKTDNSSIKFLVKMPTSYKINIFLLIKFIFHSRLGARICSECPVFNGLVSPHRLYHVLSMIHYTFFLGKRCANSLQASLMFS